MKLICVEEHSVDPGLAQASAHVIEREAPYMHICCTPNAASRPRDPHHPTLTSEALSATREMLARTVPDHRPLQAA